MTVMYFYSYAVLRDKFDLIKMLQAAGPLLSQTGDYTSYTLSLARLKGNTEGFAQWSASEVLRKRSKRKVSTIGFHLWGLLENSILE